MKTLKNIQLVNIEGGRELVKPCRGYLIIPFEFLSFGFFGWNARPFCRKGSWISPPTPPAPVPKIIEMTEGSI